MLLLKEERQNCTKKEQVILALLTEESSLPRFY